MHANSYTIIHILEYFYYVFFNKRWKVSNNYNIKFPLPNNLWKCGLCNGLELLQHGNLLPVTIAARASVDVANRIIQRTAVDVIFATGCLRGWAAAIPPGTVGAASLVGQARRSVPALDGVPLGDAEHDRRVDRAQRRHSKHRDHAHNSESAHTRHHLFVSWSSIGSTGDQTSEVRAKGKEIRRGDGRDNRYMI